MTRLFDVVIVGSGAAGVAASIEAVAVGSEVLVVDQLPYLGGTARISGGGTLAVGTKMQEEFGVKDSVEVAVNDWLNANGPDDRPWAEYYANRSLNEVYRWAERRGVPWDHLKPPEEGNSIPRRHYPRNGGLAMMEALIQSVKDRVEWRTSATCQSLIREDGRFSGINLLDSKSGRTEEIRARAVVFTTGGYCSNLDLILEFAPNLGRYRIMEGSGEGAKGLGHQILRRQDVAFTHLGHMCLYCYATPDYKDPQGRRGLVIRKIHGNIWVNAQGQRFHNEVDYGADRGTRAYMAQDPPQVWAILDSTMASHAEVADPDYRRGDEIFLEKVIELFDNSPYVKKHSTIEGLASKIGVNPTTLTDTVKTYNTYFEQNLKRDPQFDKPLTGLKPIDAPPFYAIQFFLLARKSLGGVATNLQGQVLTRNFTPIPGLYAAGELASPARCHIGYLGHTIGQCLLSGRLAGAGASRETGHGDGTLR